jgi:membrane-associated phospholipid phosphatase
MRRAFALSIFLLLGLGWLQPLDRVAYQALHTEASQLAIWASHCGDFLAYLVAAATAGWLYCRRRSDLPAYLWLLAGQHLLTHGNKWLFHTLRPEQPHTVGGYAYPSGHTMMAVSVYGYLSHQTTGWKRRLLLALPCLVAWSRVALGHHWLSDVLGGLVLGFLWLEFCLRS